MKKDIRIVICWLSIVNILPMGIINISMTEIENTNSNIISLHYSFKEPIVEKITVFGQDFHIFKIPDLPLSNDVGLPVLPIKPINILLPQGGMLDSVEVIAKDKVVLGKGFRVMLGGKPMPISDAITVPIPPNNTSLFDATKPYPPEAYTIIGTHYFRGYAILTITLHPLYYIEEIGEVYYYKNMTVRIKISETVSNNPLFRGLPEDEDRVKQIVENPSMVSTYNLIKNKPVSTSSLVNPSDSYDYVIITSNYLKNAEADYTFRDLAEYKNKSGLKTIIVTVEDIKNNPSYWNTTNPLFNDTQAKIRNFIRDAYMNWGIKYVLLGGDSDIIPARTFVARGEQGYFYDYNDIAAPPSDVYYCCLDGNYNYDEDMRWGETTDGENGGDVDLRAEVYVGRACVGSKTEMSNFVKKTIQYEFTYDSYIEEVLLAGEDMGWSGAARWGGNHLDEIVDGSTLGGYTTVGIPSNEYNINKLYDRDWPGNNWPKEELIKRMNRGVHIICHDGHAWDNYNMKLENSDVKSLVNEKYFFAYSTGCWSGAFDNPHGRDCIAEYFTVKTEHGAFAGIWNTRYGWGGGEYKPYNIIDYGNHRYIREFWDAVFGEGIKEIGKANQDSKEDNIWRINEVIMRYCFYTITLFGDPSAPIKEVDKNPPTKPAKPTGESKGEVGQEYHYTTCSLDQDGDSLYYMWDWGDGNFSDWLGPYDSGEIVTASYTWTEKGTYAIRVKAKDIHHRESPWSDPLVVSMPKSYYPLWTLLEKINEWLISTFGRELLPGFL
ncbi:MAG: PKD domain-containing protein [Thermoplasmata archaeon]|nr:MAG: PKD domain-containing protein [Thermoplasmata archaeon]